MLKREILTFRSGSVLTKEKLEMLYKIPQDLISVMFYEKSDGVIAGLDLKVEHDCVIINPGIYKFNGRIYINTEETEIPFSDFKSGEAYSILIDDSVEIIQKDDGIETESLKFKPVKGKMDNAENEIKSRRLYSFFGFPKEAENYDDLKRNIEIRIVPNLIYATNHKKTFPPYVFDYIYEKLMEKKNKNVMDYIMLNTISIDGVVSVDMIFEYIRSVRPEYTYDEDKLLYDFVNSIDMVFELNNSEDEKTVDDDDFFPEEI